MENVVSNAGVSTQGVGTQGVGGFWRGRRVLVTGHTGFKGAWLSLWLTELGARVGGLALAPNTQPSLHALLGAPDGIIADINDRAALTRAFAQEPEIVFHLAAQALVRDSYKDPVATFAANVTGVVSVLDAVRRAPSVRACVIVTSDKCYDNREWVWGYRETDALGGHDPYSASKGCAEIAAASMRRSFFGPHAQGGGHPARIATVRAGNVIGGGDWSADRLVPDIVRGCLGPTAEVFLRNPEAVRPWQHVLDPLAAYLRLAELLASGAAVDDAWNIGPEASDNRAVADVARALVRGLGVGRVVSAGAPDGPHEAHLLTLDCAKARGKLGWTPRADFAASVAMTADWYSAWHRGCDMARFSREQIAAFQGSSPPGVAA